MTTCREYTEWIDLLYELRIEIGLAYDYEDHKAEKEYLDAAYEAVDEARESLINAREGAQ